MRRIASRWKRLSRRNKGITVGAAIIVVIIAIATSKPAKTNTATAGETTISATTAPTPTTDAPVTATAATAPTSTTTTTPPGPATTFADGTWVVGKQIAPGTYQTNGGDGCYWERDKNLSGSGLPIANDNTSGHAVVTILATDAGFKTASCGTWTPLPTAGPDVSTFGDGIWAVGVNIAPGTYSAPGGANCYWEREADFGGGLPLANDNPSGPVTVTVLSTDRGFKTQGCGTWRRS